MVTPVPAEPFQATETDVVYAKMIYKWSVRHKAFQQAEYNGYSKLSVHGHLRKIVSESETPATILRRRTPYCKFLEHAESLHARLATASTVFDRQELARLMRLNSYFPTVVQATRYIVWCLGLPMSKGGAHLPLDHYLPPGTASGTIREEALPENALQFNQDELGLLHPRPQSPSLSDSELPSAETGQPSTAAPSSPPSKLARYRMSAPHLPPRSSPHAPLLDPIAPERKLDPKQATERDVKIAEHVLEEFRLHAIPRGLWTERSYRECLESLQEPVPTDMRLNMSQASYALRRDRDFAQLISQNTNFKTWISNHPDFDSEEWDRLLKLDKRKVPITQLTRYLGELAGYEMYRPPVRRGANPENNLRFHPRSFVDDPKQQSRIMTVPKEEISWLEVEASSSDRGRLVVREPALSDHRRHTERVSFPFAETLKYR